MKMAGNTILVIAALRSAITRWAERRLWTDALAEFLISLFVALSGLWLVLLVPIQVLLVVSRSAARKSVSGLPVELGTTSEATLVITIALTAIFSAVLAGFTREFLTRSVNHRWWALLFMVAGVTLPVWIAHMLRPVTALPDVQSGDAPLVVTYLAAWLLLVGYTSKVPWDHARDLWAGRFEQLWASGRRSNEP